MISYKAYHQSLASFTTTVYVQNGPFGYLHLTEKGHWNHRTKSSKWNCRHSRSSSEDNSAVGLHQGRTWSWLKQSTKMEKFKSLNELYYLLECTDLEVSLPWRKRELRYMPTSMAKNDRGIPCVGKLERATAGYRGQLTVPTKVMNSISSVEIHWPSYTFVSKVYFSSPEPQNNQIIFLLLTHGRSAILLWHHLPLLENGNSQTFMHFLWSANNTASNCCNVTIVTPVSIWPHHSHKNTLHSLPKYAAFIEL